MLRKLNSVGAVPRVSASGGAAYRAIFVSLFGVLGCGSPDTTTLSIPLEQPGLGAIAAVGDRRASGEAASEIGSDRQPVEGTTGGQTVGTENPPAPNQPRALEESPTAADEPVNDQVTFADTQRPPVYAIASKLRTLAGWESYVFLTDNLDSDVSEGEAVLRSQASGVHAVGPEREGSLFVAENGGDVTRYELTNSGGLEQVGEPLSFDSVLSSGPFGEYGSSFQFVSPNKAYYIHGSYMVVWNPATMELVKTVVFSRDGTSIGVGREGYVASVSASPLRVGNEIFAVVGWSDVSRGIFPEVDVIVVNTETDEVTVRTDPRCGFAREGVLASDGNIYLATEAYATAVHFDNPSKGAQPCLLRFDPASKEFDADFFVTDLRAPPSDEREALGASELSLIASLVKGPEDATFIKVLDPKLAAGAQSLGEPRFLSSAEPVFRWARVQLSDTPSLEILNRAPVTGSTVPLTLGARTFAPAYRFEWLVEGVIRMPVETEFVELYPDAPGDIAFRVPGQSFSALRLR